MMMINAANVNFLTYNDVTTKKFTVCEFECLWTIFYSLQIDYFKYIHFIPADRASLWIIHLFFVFFIKKQWFSE